MSETLLDLVGLLYEASADSTLWTPFVERLTQVLRAPWCVFYVHDFTRPKVDINAEIGFDPAYLRTYREHYLAKNVFLIHGKKYLRPGIVSPTERLCPDALLLKSEFYNDWLVPQRMRNGINATVLRTKSLVGLFGMIREEGAAAVDADDLALVRALMPHLQRAVQLHEKFSELRALEQTARAALDWWTIGVVLLDHRGDVLSVNRAAEKLVNDRDGLTVVRRGLQTNRPDETARLRGLIASALTAERLSEYGAGGAMAVSRSDDRAPLNVLVAPLSSSRLVLSESRAQCVLFVGDPESEDAPDDQILRQFYGLTSAESRLAVHLMSGAGLKTAADELSVSLNTARTHLKRLFEKTQTTRQAELVRLLLRGPAGLNRPS